MLYDPSTLYITQTHHWTGGRVHHLTEWLQRLYSVYLQSKFLEVKGQTELVKVSGVQTFYQFRYAVSVHSQFLPTSSNKRLLFKQVCHPRTYHHRFTITILPKMYLVSCNTTQGFLCVADFQTTFTSLSSHTWSVQRHTSKISTSVLNSADSHYIKHTQTCQ